MKVFGEIIFILREKTVGFASSENEKSVERKSALLFRVVGGKKIRPTFNVPFYFAYSPWIRDWKFLLTGHVVAQRCLVCRREMFESVRVTDFEFSVKVSVLVFASVQPLTHSCYSNRGHNLAVVGGTKWSRAASATCQRARWLVGAGSFWRFIGSLSVSSVHGSVIGSQVLSVHAEWFVLFVAFFVVVVFLLRVRKEVAWNSGRDRKPHVRLHCVMFLFEDFFH